MSIESYCPPLSAELIQVIHISAMRGGSGPRNPARLVEYYYEPGGRMLACYDPINGPPDYVIAAPTDAVAP